MHPELAKLGKIHVRVPSYKKMQISKRNGSFRTIYIVEDKNSLRGMRKIATALHYLALDVCPPKVVHGFWPARSCVTNAMCHVNKKYSVCFDLKDFFDHCTRDKLDRVINLLPLTTFESITPDGAARQGLCTSPVLSSIAAAEMDHYLLSEIKPGMVYTRYADDLTFSLDDFEQAKALLKTVPEAVQQCGFVVNERKTKMQYAGAGRRIITGIAVDSQIHPTRKSKRLLRAARFKAKVNANPHYEHRALGLEEWVKCREPVYGKIARNQIRITKEVLDKMRVAAAATAFK